LITLFGWKAELWAFFGPYRRNQSLGALAGLYIGDQIEAANDYNLPSKQGFAD